MKVENTDIDALDRVFVAMQVFNGELDYRFIGPESKEAIDYVNRGWEVYPFLRLGCLVKKDGKVVYK